MAKGIEADTVLPTLSIFEKTFSGLIFNILVKESIPNLFA